MEGLEITPQLMGFGAIASVAAIAAVGVVAFNNAVRSALCLVLNFFLLAVIYFTLNAQTLGIIQIVVYTGAIMVLFLFVIMLLNLGGMDILIQKKDPKLIIGGVLGLGLFALVASQIFLQVVTVNSPRADDGYGRPELIGGYLFSNYVWPFELASFLLLIGIVGSILLAKRRMIARPLTDVEELQPEVTE